MLGFKKSVITGASGFIGQALVKKLLDLNVVVTAIENRPVKNPDFEIINLDIRTKGVLDPFLSQDTVLFHMAGRADVGASVTDARGDFEINTCGLFEVLESARKSNCRFIFPSTGSVFDPSNHQPVNEKSLMRPSSPYAAAKLAGEAYCIAYARSYGLDTRIARLFSVYGIGMRRFIIHDLVKKILSQPRELLIKGDGQQVRDYLYIDDVVTALILIASRGQTGNDYNVASGQPVKILDLASKITQLMEHPETRIIPSGSRHPEEVPVWFADISKIGKIGFTPSVSFEEGLKKTVTWLCEQYSQSK